MSDTLADLYAIPSPEQLDIRKASIISTDSYTDERLDFCPVGLKQKEPNFGLLFDIDGVLLRGATPIPEALLAMDLLKGRNGKLRVPIAFVTNACGNAQAKVDQLSSILNIELKPEQVIFAPSPFQSFTHWHDMRVLVVGQGDMKKIAEDLGFKHVYTMEQVAEAWPLLDMVNHENRKIVAKGYKENKDFPRIEAIVLMGEPVQWEMYLQLLVDLLMTNGKPDHKPEAIPKNHLPVLACNMDLLYMGQACMPRFGHGAFLVCLESLYERVSGYPLKYTALVGKPSEITYRFSEHILSKVAKRMGISRPLRKIYFFGDNPEVDILGANLYNMYLRRYRRLSGGRDVSAPEQSQLHMKAAVASSRTVPADATFLPQTCRGVEAILVQTGVYKPGDRQAIRSKPLHCHRDFMGAVDLILPTFEAANVLEGIKLLLVEESFDPKLP
ncbi:cat eye syndrome critical region protein 5 [Echinococcus multilocularis]|uniref:Cat eye syndrome critical region protein 5 n=1 Tax=Echinococcus multilocularis TaxID=6211 RepID=A0A068YD55_ECHMU|nr:cat eye syndrome critical region protein 5 [Echinococcus multilocularis]